MNPDLERTPSRRDGVRCALESHARTVEKALKHILASHTEPPRLAEAMRYAVFTGGKRVRPFLVLEATRFCGAPVSKGLPLACALEMIHTYSLVHDDLPAMDDDDWRRGKKTCHRRYDEATAILVGDALLTLAFEVLAASRAARPEAVGQTIRALARAAGPYGMVGGQALDMRHQKTTQNLALMNRINGLKTGCLIAVSLEGAALWAGAPARAARALVSYGQTIGFLFQVVDDIMDGDGYARILGKKGAYRKAALLRDEAQKGLAPFGRRGEVLSAFADYLYSRTR